MTQGASSPTTLCYTYARDSVLLVGLQCLCIPQGPTTSSLHKLFCVRWPWLSYLLSCKSFFLFEVFFRPTPIKWIINSLIGHHELPYCNNLITHLSIPLDYEFFKGWTGCFLVVVALGFCFVLFSYLFVSPGPVSSKYFTYTFTFFHLCFKSVIGYHEIRKKTCVLNNFS